MGGDFSEKNVHEQPVAIARNLLRSDSVIMAPLSLSPSNGRLRDIARGALINNTRYGDGRSLSVNTREYFPDAGWRSLRGTAGTF